MISVAIFIDNGFTLKSATPLYCSAFFLCSGFTDVVGIMTLILEV
jgi:hypothetical protein